jgi:hypothetical protein
VNHDDGASANQVTSATILNIVNIRIKNNTTVMVSDLPSRHELYGQIRNKRNIRDERSQKKECPVQPQKEGIHRQYEQCNGENKVVKKKVEQNEESYEKKRRNQDTKNKYLEKER